MVFYNVLFLVVLWHVGQKVTASWFLALPSEACTFATFQILKAVEYMHESSSWSDFSMFWYVLVLVLVICDLFLMIRPLQIGCAVLVVYSFFFFANNVHPEKHGMHILPTWLYFEQIAKNH